MQPILFLTICLLIGLSKGQLIDPVSLPLSIQPPALTATHNDGFFLQNQPQFNAIPSQSLAHHDVLINDQHEALLPSNLKNPFYKNPRIAEVLAKESWFGPGEHPVQNRETEKIPRERIWSVLKNAGLARRR